MNSDQKLRKSTSFLSQMSTSSATYHHFSISSSHQIDQTTPPNPKISIPIHSSDETPVPIPVALPPSTLAAASIKIQSAFRSHLIRTLINRIRSVNADADRFERRIQRQETVDAVRKDERERLKVSEGLMALLLKLDTIPAYFDPAVRDLRRTVSRRIVGLQEVLDAIVGGEVEGGFEVGFPASWDEVLERVWGDQLQNGEEGERGRRSRCLECLEEFVKGF